MFRLRDYQEEMVTAVRESVMAGNKRVLMVGSTGLGKTAILFDISRKAVEKGGKVLLLVHRRGLALQTAKKFEKYGIKPGILMSAVEPDLDNPIQVCSVWTYRNRLKLAPTEFNKFYVDATLVLIDECHRSLSPVFKEVMAKYSDKIAIGVTATPCLSSEAAMGAMYDDLVDVVPIKRLIKEGHLVGCTYYGGSSPDMKGVKTVRGDWDIKELGKKSDTPGLVGDVVTNWLRLASDRSTIVFAVNRSHGHHLCDSFKKKGVAAEYLDSFSTDEERADVLRQLENGDIQMIVNVALFQEFLDAPIVSCIVVARKTKSLGLWRQLIGRALRPYPEKTEALIIDHADGVRTLGMIEDDIEWTLEGKKAYKKKKQPKKEKPLFECEQCHFFHKNRACPQCGLEVKSYGKKVETTDEKLKEITQKGKKKSKPTMADKRKFFGQLEYERRMKGYKEGWKFHKFKAKFGIAPHHSLNDVGTVQPDAAFFNFLTYQNIKYAKSRQKTIDK